MSTCKLLSYLPVSPTLRAVGLQTRAEPDEAVVRIRLCSLEPGNVARTFFVLPLHKFSSLG